VAVTTDHSTPCELKEHSADSVPILLYGGKGEDKVGRDTCLAFNEKQARKGDLGVMEGKELLKKIEFA
jgi:2,3-bisphosphoglycerate-independent phosphoglycerate mutase